MEQQQYSTDYVGVVQKITTNIISHAEREAEEKAALILKNKERLRQPK